MKNFFLLIFSFLLNFTLFAQPTDGLVAHYPLDGNAEDISGNSFNGTVYGASSASNRFGINSSALSFDGFNDWIEIADDELLRLHGDFTISLWVKVDALSNPTAHAILSKRTSISGEGYLMLVNGSNHPTPSQFPASVNFVVSGGSDPAALSESSISLGEWVNILYEYEEASGLCKGYFNNELVISAPINVANESTTATLKIGKDGQSVNDFYFDGFIDDIRMYNRLLTNDEKEEILQEDALTGTVTIEEEILCFGEATGEISFAAQGGAPEYLYSIDGGMSTQSSPLFQNLSAGEFQPQIIDAQGSVLILDDILLDEPEALIAAVEIIDNNITVTPFGGVGNYMFSINSGDFQTEASFSDLSPGTYIITVRDENDCEFTTSEIDIISSIKEFLLPFSIYPSPAESFIIVNIADNDLVKNIKIVDYLGRTVEEIKYSSGSKISLDRMQNGVYFLLLEDAKGKLIGRNKFVKFAEIRA